MPKARYKHKMISYLPSRNLFVVGFDTNVTATIELSMLHRDMRFVYLRYHRLFPLIKLYESFSQSCPSISRDLSAIVIQTLLHHQIRNVPSSVSFAAKHIKANSVEIARSQFLYRISLAEVESEDSSKGCLCDRETERLTDIHEIKLYIER